MFELFVRYSLLFSCLFWLLGFFCCFCDHFLKQWWCCGEWLSRATHSSLDNARNGWTSFGSEWKKKSLDFNRRMVWVELRLQCVWLVFPCRVASSACCSRIDGVLFSFSFCVDVLNARPHNDREYCLHCVCTSIYMYVCVCVRERDLEGK